MIEILHSLLFAAGLLGLLATLPGTMEMFLVTAGAFRGERQRAAGKAAKACRLAIVIPAHNEAALIGRCIETLIPPEPSPSERASGYRKIVVVADNCTDDTAERAMEAGARVLVRTDPERRGKGYALRIAFDQLLAEGFDAFLVIDADSVVSKNLFCAVVQRLNAGAAAVQCRYRVANADGSLRTRLMDVAFLAFNVLRPKGRSGWGLSAGILGNGFALRSETLQKVPYHAASIVEDLEYHLRLVSAGERVDFIDEATVFGEIPMDSEAARVQRSRWEGGRLRMVREWAPRLAAGVLRGQWRLAEPLLDLLSLPLAYQVLLLAVLLFLPEPFRTYGGFGAGLAVVHVFAATTLGGQTRKALLALASAPFYIAWKLTTLDAVFSASRKDARWVRTGRDRQGGLKPVK